MRELLQLMKNKKITKKFEKFIDSLSDKERIDRKVKKVISKLKKASKAHAGQARTLQRIIKKK